MLRRVDGRALTKSDLGDFVLRYVPDRAADAMARLVEEAVVDAEARREGVTVPPELLRARTDAYVEDRRKDARVQYGATVDFEKLLLERYGRGLEGFRADAERLVRVELLCDRLVRLDQFREDGVEVRVLVLATQDAALDAARSLRAGADMTVIAERAGARRPAPPAQFARGEIPEKDVEARLFAAATGDVLDPVPFGAAGGVFWQVFKVTRAWKGAAEPWTTIAGRVEDSLRAFPASQEERRRWRGRAFARHEIAEGGDAGGAKGSVRTSAGQ